MALVGCKGRKGRKERKERKGSKRMATFPLLSLHYSSIPRIAVGKLNAIRCLGSIDILVHYHMFMTTQPSRRLRMTTKKPLYSLPKRSAILSRRSGPQRVPHHSFSTVSHLVHLFHRFIAQIYIVSCCIVARQCGAQLAVNSTAQTPRRA